MQQSLEQNIQLLTQKLQQLAQQHQQYKQDLQSLQQENQQLKQRLAKSQKPEITKHMLQKTLPKHAKQVQNYIQAIDQCIAYLET